MTTSNDSSVISPPENPGLPQASDLDRIRRMDAVLQEFQKLSPTIGIGQLRAILWAALVGRSGYQHEFVERLNMSETAASGNLDFWTKWCRNKVKPAELLIKEQAIENRTLNRVYLTQEGERFVKLIIDRLDPSKPVPNKDN